MLIILNSVTKQSVSLPYFLHGATLPNCIGAGIKIKTVFNVPRWEYYLNSYWDQQLLAFIKYGFPLDITVGESFSPISSVKNHTSAEHYSAHVKKFLETEVQLGAILGPLSRSVPNLHCSPMLTRPKPGSQERRVIVDLSWPSGGSRIWVHRLY